MAQIASPISGSPDLYFRRFLFALLVMLVSFAAAPAAAIPTFQKADTCDFSEHDIECGIVRVLEDRSAGSGALLEINIYTVKSFALEPAPDPIVFLTGGPGNQAKNDVYSLYVADALREKRDIIVVDQRGTDDRSDLCPDLASDNLRTMYLDRTFEEAEADYERRLDVCFDQLHANGRNIDAINNRDSALDIRDVRLALGIERWNVWGVSYGTALGLEVMTIDRDGIRAAILDSLVPIDIPWDQDLIANYYESLSRLSDYCLKKPACRLNYGDLSALRAKALQSLKQNPMRFPYYFDYDARALGRSSVGILNDHDLATLVHGLSYFDTDVNLVPLFLQAVLDRDERTVSAIVTYQLSMLNAYAMDDGTHFAVACSINDVPAGDVSSGPSGFLPYDDLRLDPHCRRLGLKALQNRTMSFDRVTVPTLLMSGEFDPVTPPKWGTHVEGLLPKARHLIFPQGFHAVSSTPCGESILTAFVDDPEGNYDVSCAYDAEPILFASGLVTSRIGERFVGYLATPISWVIFALPLLILVIWLMVQGVTAARFGVGAVSHSSSAVLVAGLMVVYAAWLGASLAETYAAHSNIVWMGIGFVPLITGLFTWMTPIGLIAGPVLAVQSAKEMRRGTLAEPKGWERIAVGVSVLILCLLLVRDGVVPDLIRFF